MQCSVFVRSTECASQDKTPEVRYNCTLVLENCLYPLECTDHSAPCVYFSSNFGLFPLLIVHTFTLLLPLSCIFRSLINPNLSVEPIHSNTHQSLPLTGADYTYKRCFWVSHPTSPLLQIRDILTECIWTQPRSPFTSRTFFPFLLFCLRALPNAFARRFPSLSNVLSCISAGSAPGKPQHITNNLIQIPNPQTSLHTSLQIWYSSENNSFLPVNSASLQPPGKTIGTHSADNKQTLVTDYKMCTWSWLYKFTRVHHLPITGKGGWDGCCKKTVMNVELSDVHV